MSECLNIFKKNIINPALNSSLTTGVPLEIILYNLSIKKNED